METRRIPRVRTRSFIDHHSQSDTDVSSLSETEAIPDVDSSSELSVTRTLNFEISVCDSVSSSDGSPRLSSQLLDDDSGALDSTFDFLASMPPIGFDIAKAVERKLELGSPALSSTSLLNETPILRNQSEVDSGTLNLADDFPAFLKPISFDLQQANEFKRDTSAVDFLPLVKPEGDFDTLVADVVVTIETLTHYPDFNKFFMPAMPEFINFKGEPNKHHNGENALIFSSAELPKLLDFPKTVDDLPRYEGLHVIRHAVRVDGSFYVGREGIPNSTNKIPSHRDLSGNGKSCIASGNSYFNAQNELAIINNKSGDFSPPFETIKFALLAYKNLGIKFAEIVQIEKLDSSGGVACIYRFKRDFLLECLALITPLPLQDISNLSSSASDSTLLTVATVNEPNKLFSKTPYRAGAKRAPFWNELGGSFVAPTVSPSGLNGGSANLSLSDKENETNKKQKPCVHSFTVSPLSANRYSSFSASSANNSINTTVNSDIASSVTASRQPKSARPKMLRFGGINC